MNAKNNVDTSKFHPSYLLNGVNIMSGKRLPCMNDQKSRITPQAAVIKKKKLDQDVVHSVI